MKAHQKIALVLLGYVAALMIAVFITYVLDAMISTADDGMAAGGAVMRFLLAFVVLSMIPTALAIRFLSPPNTCAWDVGVKVSRFAAATGVAALIAFVPILWWERNPAMSPHLWMGLAMLAVGMRLVGSLVFGAVDLVALLCVPKPGYRMKFFQTGLIEGMVFAGGVALFLYWPRHIFP